MLCAAGSAQVPRSEATRMTTSGHPKAREEENEALTCELLEHEERTRGAELAAVNAYKQHGELNK